MPNSDPPRNEFSDSDQLWFDRLSGKPVPADQLDSAAVREADQLRRAFQLEEQRQVRADPALRAAVSDESIRHQWQRLRFALKRKGVLPGAAAPAWRRWPAVAGLAAALLAAVVLLPLQRGGEDLDEPPGLRGEFVLKRQAVADPAARAKAFAAALNQAGLSPGLYRRDKTYIVDIDLKPDRSPAAAPAFRSLGLEAAPGYWRIEFAAPVP